MQYYFDSKLSDDEILRQYIEEVKKKKNVNPDFISKISKHSNLHLIKHVNARILITADVNLDITENHEITYTFDRGYKFETKENSLYLTPQKEYETEKSFNKAHKTTYGKNLQIRFNRFDHSLIYGLELCSAPGSLWGTVLNEQNDSEFIQKCWSSIGFSSFENFYDKIRNNGSFSDIKPYSLNYNGIPVNESAFEEELKSAKYTTCKDSATCIDKIDLLNIQVQGVQFYYGYEIVCSFESQDYKAKLDESVGGLTFRDLEFAKNKSFVNNEQSKKDTVDRIAHTLIILGIIICILNIAVFVPSIFLKNRVIVSSSPEWFKNFVRFPVTLCNLIPTLIIVCSLKGISDTAYTIRSHIYCANLDGNPYSENLFKKMFADNIFYFIVICVAPVYNIIQITAFCKILI